MTKSRTTATKRIPLLALAFLLVGALVGAASAAPKVSTRAMTVRSGDLQGYLLANSANPAGNGPCYTRAPDPTQSFTCYTQALLSTGVGLKLVGTSDLTLFAPTDQAFESLADTIGDRRFQAFMDNSTGLVSWLQRSLVSQVHSVTTLSYHAVTASGTAQLATSGTQTLDVTFDKLAESPTTTTIAVGPAGADGQAYVTGRTVRFRHGSLIPVDHVFVETDQIPSEITASRSSTGRSLPSGAL